MTEPSQNPIGHLQSVDAEKHPDNQFSVDINNDDSNIAVAWGETYEEASERAAFIVRACNNHEALVSACRMMLDKHHVSYVQAEAAIVQALGVIDGNPVEVAAVAPVKRTIVELEAMEGKVCDALKRRGIVAHLEYQDWINVPVGEDFYWAWGTNNPKWSGDFSNCDGDWLESVQVDFASDHVSDGEDIADAIVRAMHGFDYATYHAPKFGVVTKWVVWAYATSANAQRFGYAKTGCWCVETSVGTNPPKAIAGYADKVQATAHAEKLPYAWNKLGK